MNRSPSKTMLPFSLSGHSVRTEGTGGHDTKGEAWYSNMRQLLEIASICLKDNIIIIQTKAQQEDKDSGYQGPSGMKDNWSLANAKWDYQE